MVLRIDMDRVLHPNGRGHLISEDKVRAVVAVLDVASHPLTVAELARRAGLTRKSVLTALQAIDGVVEGAWRNSDTYARSAELFAIPAPPRTYVSTPLEVDGYPVVAGEDGRLYLLRPLRPM